MDKSSNIFKDKILLITGGTGSFGNKVLKRLLGTDIKEIRIFSRDEKKQDDMRKRYNNDKIKLNIVYDRLCTAIYESIELTLIYLQMQRSN